MSKYTPPDCDGFKLSYTYNRQKPVTWDKVILRYNGGHYFLEYKNPYVAPAACAPLLLNFGGTGLTTIASSDFVIQNKFEKAVVIIPINILSTDVIVRNKLQKSFVDLITVLKSSDLKISLGLQKSVYEELRFIISSDTEIVLEFGKSETGGGQPNDLPSGIKPDYSIKYGSPAVTNSELKSSYNEAIKKDVRDKIVFGSQNKINREVSPDYISKLVYDDLAYKILFGTLKSFIDTNTELKYEKLLNFDDLTSKIPWGAFKDIEEVIVSKFLYPPAKDLKKIIPWGSFLSEDVTSQIPYKLPGILEKHHRVRWGQYWWSLLCEKLYYPPSSTDKIPLSFAEDMSSYKGACKDLLLYFGYAQSVFCPFTSLHTGTRDDYTLGSLADIIPTTPDLKVYYMMNTLFVQRLPDNAPIEVSSVSMNIDTDSWLWSFSLTIVTKSYLDLIKPQNGTFIDIAINCNGWVWICKVECWQENISFGQKSWTVTGRSPSVELSAPYSLTQTYMNDSDKSAPSIITDILQGTGWNFDWNATDYYNPVTDWTIPAGIFNVADVTPIKAVQYILDAVGAYIQTPCDTNTDKTLYFKPRYNKQPWLWSQETPDKIFNTGVFLETGRTYMSFPDLNTVLVSGQQTGVIVNAKIDGTAGDKQASTFTNPLIVTRKAGTEKARQILSPIKNWVKHTVKVFSLAASGQEPSLTLPGTMLEVVEEDNTTWIGQVTGTTVTAGWQNTGLVVYQTLELEQYYE